ncbi:MAG: inositol monophosphatase family protein [Planctomycetota bacterium]|nr:inositol monophosphatase family protein [Planctomycetota bacterium]
MEKQLKIAISAARAAGEILVDLMGKVDVREKKPRDLVTEADLASQEKIQEIIGAEYPEHQFIGEEGGSLPSVSNGFAWVVDPLDGTTNFVHQLRSFSVSIALLENRQPVVGVVHDPLLDECFYATRTGGAFLNGEPIQTSGCEKLHNAMVVTGFSPSVTKESIEARRFLEMLGKAQTIRRLGSAALNLCFLACGRVDAYWASSLNAWDIAAGTLILSEAGGFLRPIEGEFDLFRPQFIAASTDTLASEISETINFSN